MTPAAFQLQIALHGANLYYLPLNRDCTAKLERTQPASAPISSSISN